MVGELYITTPRNTTTTPRGPRGPGRPQLEPPEKTQGINRAVVCNLARGRVAVHPAVSVIVIVDVAIIVIVVVVVVVAIVVFITIKRPAKYDPIFLFWPHAQS